MGRLSAIKVQLELEFWHRGGGGGGGGSWQRASRLVNNGVHGFVLLVRLLAVPYWPPGHPKQFLILLFYTSWYILVLWVLNFRGRGELLYAKE